MVNDYWKGHIVEKLSELKCINKFEWKLNKNEKINFRNGHWVQCQ